jgi:amidase
MAATGAAALGDVTPAPAVARSALDYRTAGDLLKALANRHVSSRDLVDAAIARIEALDGKINAVVVRDFDRACEAAAVADAARARGERRPLLGLPITVKESFNISGLPTSLGDPKFEERRPKADTLAVERLKAAGAVILGKTNLPLAGSDWQSYNEVYGTTNNPWDLTRTPGGSSGGPAAALAAGYVPMELGSDSGGSLRCPAHFCGVFSHKTSLDLIPLRGAALPVPIPLRGDLLVIGPMARSAVDLALELSVLAGPDPLTEGVGYKLALPPPRHARFADFRVLVLDEHPFCPTAASITGALNELVGRLEKLGCRINRSHPKLPDLPQTTRTFRELEVASHIADLPPETIEQMNARAKTLAPDDQSYSTAVVRGVTISHADWIRQSRARAELRARWLDLFHDIDVVLCPPMPIVAFPHDHSPQFDRQLDIDGTKVAYRDQGIWAGIATLIGLPATTMPIGKSPEGLPIGVQIIGGYLEDRTTIAFAGLIEREFGGFTPPAL